MDCVRAYAENCDDWDQLLPFATFAYNSSVHSAKKFTLFALVFGKIARIPSSFPSNEKLETYGSYLQELICRLTEIKNMAADNLLKGKQYSKLNYDTENRIKNADHEAARKILKILEYSYYFSEERNIENEIKDIYVLCQGKESRVLIKLCE